MAKGLPTDTKTLPDVAAELERIKRYLWHSNVFRALQEIEDLIFGFDCYEGKSSSVKKLEKAIGEFFHYISVNRDFIPNYSERHWYGEKISTAFVESTVNEVISK
jgi:hypothetical protein